MLALESGTFTQISKQAQPTIKTHQLKEGQSLECLSDPRQRPPSTHWDTQVWAEEKARGGGVCIPGAEGQELSLSYYFTWFLRSTWEQGQFTGWGGICVPALCKASTSGNTDCALQVELPFCWQRFAHEQVQPHLHPEPTLFPSTVNILKSKFVFTTGLIL